MKLGDKIREAMAKIDEVPAKTYQKGEIKTMLNTLAAAADRAAKPPIEDTCRAPTTVSTIVRGDVFIANTYGGKARPWVVLRVRGETVYAVAFSSGETAPELQQSHCRYWPGSWLGSATAVFTIAQATKEVTRPYTNLAHLFEIEQQILARAEPVKPKDIGQILSKLRGRKQAQEAHS